jgi:hypothetical protein
VRGVTVPLACRVRGLRARGQRPAACTHTPCWRPAFAAGAPAPACSMKRGAASLPAHSKCEPRQARHADHRRLSGAQTQAFSAAGAAPPRQAASCEGTPPAMRVVACVEIRLRTPRGKSNDCFAAGRLLRCTLEQVRTAQGSCKQTLHAAAAACTCVAPPPARRNEPLRASASGISKIAAQARAAAHAAHVHARAPDRKPAHTSQQVRLAPLAGLLRQRVSKGRAASDLHRPHGQRVGAADAALPAAAARFARRRRGRAGCAAHNVPRPAPACCCRWANGAYACAGLMRAV